MSVKSCVRIWTTIVLMCAATACQEDNSSRQNFMQFVQNLIIYNGMSVDDITVKDEDGKVYSLSHLVKDKYIVIYFPHLDCSSCMEKGIQMLDYYFTDEEKAKLISIGKFTNVREQQIFHRKSGIHAVSINPNIMSFPLEGLCDHALIFMLSNDMKIYSVYDFDESRNFVDPYIRIITNLLKTKMN